MNTITGNATTKKNAGRNDDSFFPDSTKRLGFIEETSRVDGDEQNSVNYSYCSRTNSSRENKQSQNYPGKILERLKLLENQYLSHLEDHQKQLGSWLDESHQTEKDFKLAITELEKEIRDLISDEKQNLNKSQDTQDTH